MSADTYNCQSVGTIKSATINSYNYYPKTIGRLLVSETLIYSVFNYLQTVATVD